MIFNHSPKSIFYTLTVTALLLTGCSGGGSSNTPTVETAAVSAISGTLKEADGTVVDGATVDLDDLTTAKILTSLSTTTNINGVYTIQPPNTGDFQLKFSKDGFATQFKPITVSASGVSVTPTILSKVDQTTRIDNTTGGTVSATDNTVTQKNIDVSVPANAAGEAIDVSLTLLTGAEIPSTLPTETGKTLLPVGAISLGISPSTATLNAPATANIPVPVALQSNDTFPVYTLVEGQWKTLEDNGQAINGTLNSAKDTVSFPLQDAGIYMVMSDVPDVTVGSTESTEIDSSVNSVNITPGTVLQAGEGINRAVTNTITIDTAAVTDPNEQDEVKALVKSLLEQQNQTQFGTAEDSTIVVPDVSTNKLSSSELAAKLVCTVSLIRTTRTFTFRFTFRGIAITVPVTVTIGRFVVSCADVPDPTGATGGTG